MLYSQRREDHFIKHKKERRCQSISFPYKTDILKNWQLSLAGAFTASFAAGMNERADGGRAKLSNGESHCAEKLAGVVISRFNAFLFGHAVFRCVDEILGGTFNADDGEKSEGHSKVLTFIVAYRAAADSTADGFGNVLALAAAGASVCVTDYL